MCLRPEVFSPPSPQPAAPLPSLTRKLACESATAAAPRSTKPRDDDSFPVEQQRVAVLDAFATFVTKAMNSTVVSMMEGSSHDSEVALEGYFSLYQLLLGVGELHPCLLERLRARVEAFVGDPAQRSKKRCSSLGELLPLLPLAGVPWAAAVEAVVGEAFVRNARWAVKACPALADTHDGSSGAGAGGGPGSCGTPRETYRLRETLKANAVSLRLLAFHCVAADIVAQECGMVAERATCEVSKSSFADDSGSSSSSSSRTAWLSDLKAQAFRRETTRGKPSPRAVAALQRRTRTLRAGPSEWSDFFAGVGLEPSPTPAFLAGWLRRSVHASATLGYHNQRAALAEAERLKASARARKAVAGIAEAADKSFGYGDY